MKKSQIATAVLGRTGFEVSRVGLGTWAIGGPWTRGWGTQDETESIAAIQRAVELGVNWIDTAAVYGAGHSESVIERALAGYSDNDRPYVFTKCGRIETAEGVRSAATAKSLRSEVEGSLARLKVERIDVMQLHWPPSDVPLAEAWGTLSELRNEGKVGYLGACNLTLEQLKEIDRQSPVDVFQPPLSLVNRTALDGALDYCAEENIGTITYSPMQSGLLTGKYDRDSIALMEEGDWRRTDVEFTEPRLSRNLQIVAALRELSQQMGHPISELAIAWSLHQRGVTAAIVGARRAAQVDGWIEAACITLSPAQLQVLTDA